MGENLSFLKSNNRMVLNITLIDVGAGDSIFIEFVDDSDNRLFGLIDSNDSLSIKSSYIYIKRYFEKLNIDYESKKPNFDFVLLTHGHQDHGEGLTFLMKTFGTKRFLFPRSIRNSSQSNILRFAGKSSNVKGLAEVDNTKQISFGALTFDILWPPPGIIDVHNENNNSVILNLEFDGKKFLFGADGEQHVWNNINPLIDPETAFFKVPHHGAESGCLNKAGTCFWPKFNADVVMGISTHLIPHEHPSTSVITYLNGKDHEYYRTDNEHHITFTANSESPDILVKYSS